MYKYLFSLLLLLIGTPVFAGTIIDSSTCTSATGPPSKGVGFNSYSTFYYSTSTNNTIDTIKIWFSMTNAGLLPNPYESRVKLQIFQAGYEEDINYLIWESDFFEEDFPLNGDSVSRTYTIPDGIELSNIGDYTFRLYDEDDNNYLTRLIVDIVDDCNNETIYNASTHYKSLLGGDDNADFHATSTDPDAIWKMQMYTSLSDADYFTTYAPCETDSREPGVYGCGDEQTTAYVTIRGVLNNETPEVKMEFYAKDAENEVQYSVSSLYDTAGVHTFSQVLPTFSASASSTMNYQVCLVPPDTSSYFGYGDCVTIRFGNGYGTSTIQSWLVDEGITEPGSVATSTARNICFANYSCSDLSITDVKDGVICALCWAFLPSVDLSGRFLSLKDTLLHVNPIGYGTHIISDLTTVEATSSSMQLHSQFGATTTAIASTTWTLNLTQYGEAAEDDFPDLIWLLETIIWIVFTFWVLNLILSMNKQELT